MQILAPITRIQTPFWVMLIALSTLGLSSLSAELPKSPRGYVSDYANVLDQNTESALSSLIGEVERKTSAEIAVVTVPSLDGSDIETAAVELFKKWGIGKKGKDNGVLILMSAQDRLIRIEVGYGLESILPDGKAGEIIRNSILPYFKDGDYNKGITAGTAGVAALIAQDQGVTLTGTSGMPPTHRGRRPAKRTFLGSVFQLIFLGFLAFLFIRNPMLFLLFLGMAAGRRGGYGGGGFGGGGSGGFGGGLSGGGGSSGSW